MKLTIAFTTAREDPRLVWLLEGLEQQRRDGDEIELLVVDFYGRPFGTLAAGYFGSVGHFPFQYARVTAPKPTMWQGPHRVCKRNLWATSNARNTAIVLARFPYLAFVDDRCKLDSGWLERVRRGALETPDVVLCGPYDKHENERISYDHRRAAKPSGLVGCDGSWLFGGNFALSLENALAVNGFEEGCDPVGGEDYIFGLMLARAGKRIDFCADMSIQQDRTGVAGHPIPSMDKGTSPNDKSHAMLPRFSKRTRTEFTPDLRDLRAKFAAGEEPPSWIWPMPDPEARDWYDGQLIREIG